MPDPLPPPRDFDDAYANAAHIPDGHLYPDRWLAAAAAFRGNHPPEVLDGCDLFHPAGTPRGLSVFIHGGYWMATGPRHWSHLAQGALARGWAVAMPGYPLAPTADLATMRDAVAARVTAAAARVAGPIVLAGHSAGGQLAARLICEDTPLAAPLAARILGCVPVSGLFDLRPLRRTAMNATLGLTPAGALAESPLAHEPLAGPRIALFVGADERPEFLRQSRVLADAWAGLGAAISLTVLAGRHHFDILDDLTLPDSALCRAVAPDRPG